MALTSLDRIGIAFAVATGVATLSATTFNSPAHASEVLVCSLVSVKSGDRLDYGFVKYEADEKTVAYEWKVLRNNTPIRINAPEVMPRWTLSWDSANFWLTSTENPEYYLSSSKLETMALNGVEWRMSHAAVYKGREIVSRGTCTTRDGAWKARPNWVRASPSTTPAAAAPTVEVQAEPAPPAPAPTAPSTSSTVGILGY